MKVEKGATGWLAQY